MANWTIAGVGAIGGLWAHKLHNAGHKVTLVLKNAQQLQQYHLAGGICLHDGEQSSATQQFDARLASELSKPIENLLICCKSWQTESVLNELKGVIATSTAVVLLQNGLRQLYACQNRLASNPLYCASTTDGVFQTERFTVHTAGLGQTLLGAFNAKANQAAINLPNCEWQQNIEALLWRKLCINAVINPLTASCDVRNGDILKDSRCTAIMPSLCEEISHIATAYNHAISTEELLNFVQDVATVTAANSSSMREDVRAGRTTEINEINGYLVELANKRGLAHPLNSKLLKAIQTA